MPPWAKGIRLIAYLAAACQAADAAATTGTAPTAGPPAASPRPERAAASNATNPADGEGRNDAAAWQHALVPLWACRCLAGVTLEPNAPLLSLLPASSAVAALQALRASLTGLPMDWYASSDPCVIPWTGAHRGMPRLFAPAAFH